MKLSDKVTLTRAYRPQKKSAVIGFFHRVSPIFIFKKLTYNFLKKHFTSVFLKLYLSFKNKNNQNPMKKPVKTLVRVTLSDSFKIRPPSIYRAPGIDRPSESKPMDRPCAQMGGLSASEIQSLYPIRSPGGYSRCSTAVQCTGRHCVVPVLDS